MMIYIPAVFGDGDVGCVRLPADAPPVSTSRSEAVIPAIGPRPIVEVLPGPGKCLADDVDDGTDCECQIRDEAFSWRPGDPVLRFGI